MTYKTKPIKQRNIKQNKQAFELLKQKNSNLEKLVKVFDLQLQTLKS